MTKSVDGSKNLAPIFQESGLELEAMRQESIRRQHTVENWTMASLIAVNGGAIYGLIGLDLGGLAYGIALSLYTLGIVSALVAGRYASILGGAISWSMQTSIQMEQASKHLWRVIDKDQFQQLESAELAVRRAEDAHAEARKAVDDAYVPDWPLSIGIICFIGGCIGAAFALL